MIAESVFGLCTALYDGSGLSLPPETRKAIGEPHKAGHLPHKADHLPNKAGKPSEAAVSQGTHHAATASPMRPPSASARSTQPNASDRAEPLSCKM